MIQIDRHIEILLLDNDCVIVPGLGGFMAHHVCARYCPDTQTFLPPLRQLGFNAQLKINDSLLAQSYIEAYDISYPEAIRIIEDEVQELKQMLQNEGYCELNDIGILRLNSEGNIEFEPCEAGILTPELYGLNSVDIIPLDEINKQTVKSAAIEAEQPKEQPRHHDIFGETPKPAPELTKNEKPSSASTADTKKNKQPKKISINVSTLQRAATVAAVIAALFVCAIPFGNMKNAELTQSYMDTGVLYRLLPEDLCNPESSQRTISFRNATPVNNPKAEPLAPSESTPATTNDAEVSTDLVEKPKADEKAEPAQPQSFHSIVLASRVTRTNAEEYISCLKKSGYDKAEMIVRPNGSVKVILGRFTTEEDARKCLRDIQNKSDQFADAWIMKF